MGFLSNLKDFAFVNKKQYAVVSNTEYEEAKKGLEDLKTIANYTRPEDLSGLTPHLTLADYGNLISPIDLYQMSRYSDILRNVIPTIRNEIFRNGFDVQADDIEVSSKQDDKIWALIQRANHNEQTLKEVLMEFEDDLQIYDNGFLLAIKSYFINEDLDIIGGEIDEVLRVDPLITEKVLDRKARLGYSLDGRAMYFSLKNRSQILYEPRDSEGRQNLRACFKVRTGDKEGDVAYYDTSEIIHVSKYNPSKTYGFSQLYSLFNKVMTLINQDYYIRQYYSGSKVPKGILVANTSNANSFTTMWNQFLEKVRKNPNTINPIINQSNDPTKNTLQFISFMNNLQEMQYTEVRNEMRQQIGSLFNVSPIFQNDVSQGGGLNNEGLQITVTNRGVEIGQSVYNDKVLPWLFERNMGITDYTIRLKPSDEVDEAAEKDLRLKELQIAKATAELGIKVTMERDGSFSYAAGDVEVQQSQEPFIPYAASEKADVNKGKVSLKPGQDPPEGVKIIEGPRGGRYYESSGNEPKSEKLSPNQVKFNSGPEGYKEEVAEISADRFDLSTAKKISSGGSDRIVYELPDGKIIKIAKTPRGLAQNNAGDHYLQNEGLIPKIYESGEDYIVVENIKRDDKKSNEMLKGLKKLSYLDWENKSSKLQDAIHAIDEKYDTSIATAMDYNVLWNDFISGRNWGWDSDGRPVHVDEGTFDKSILQKDTIDLYREDWDKIVSKRKKSASKGNEVIKADKLPKAEQKRFQTALEKELDDIVSKLDFSKKPSKAEMDNLVERITKNLNKRLNAKSANFIKAIYDKAKSLVEKEVDMKFDMTEKDRNIIEGLKRDPTYRKSFDGISAAMSKNLTEIVKQAYDNPKEFTIDKIVDKMKQELESSTDNLRTIARTETSKVSIAARKAQYDKTGFNYKYRVIGPDDFRTGADSKEIVELTKNGVSWEKMVEIIQKVADKYSKGKWLVDKNAPIPRPNWRHVPVAERVDQP